MENVFKEMKRVRPRAVKRAVVTTSSDPTTTAAAV
jgi:hypothetical protein